MLLNHRTEGSEDSVCATVSFFFYTKHWTDENNYGNNAITSLANHLQAKLPAIKYDLTKVLNEIMLSLA